MNGTMALQLAAQIAIGLLLVALLLVLIRLIRGPSLADRILALDLLTTLAVALIAALVVLTGFALYVDIAIAVGLRGFLSTVALVRYLLSRTADEQETDR